MYSIKFVDTYPEHLAAPGISLELHRKRKQLDLARDIRGAKKVYLDTKFWILLRDSRLGTNPSGPLAKLLRLLETGVAKGRVVCPISADTFIELFQQTDPATLRASAQLIDDLSLGVAIIELRDRALLEVHQLLAGKARGAGAVHAVDELLWTKFAYVLGFTTPVPNFLPPEQALAVQKAFLDQRWAMKATEMLDVIGDGGPPLTEPFDDISDILNRGKIEHQHENKSFKQLFLTELWGILDLYKRDFGDIMARMYEKRIGAGLPVSDHQKQESGAHVAERIHSAFRFNSLDRELPSLWLVAGFHAAFRWDLHRKFTASDLPDFRHAVAAVPYCDYFLTEKGLRNLVADKNLRLQELFSCKTYSDPSKAVEALAAVCE